ILQGPFETIILQTGILDMLSHGTIFTYAVLGVLVCFSIVSLTIAFAKWSTFGGAMRTDAGFARAFRKANTLDAVVAAAESFRPTPLVKIFDYAYGETARQLNTHRRLINKEAISRSLQVGITEQLSRLNIISTGWQPLRRFLRLSDCLELSWALCASSMIWVRPAVRRSHPWAPAWRMPLLPQVWV